MRIERACLLPLLALFTPAAIAESTPWFFGTTAAIAHDSNIFRSGTEPMSDTTRSVGLNGGFDQPISRQRLYATGGVASNRHVRFSQLDDTSYELTTGIDWATIDHLTGSLRYLAHRGLADYGIANAPATTDKNLLRTQQFSASTRYGVHSALALEASFDHRSVGYSAVAYRSLAYSQNIGGAGLRYSVGPSLEIGLGTRLTRSETPQFQVSAGVFEPDRADRNDVDLSATLSSARTRTTVRISQSHESHSQSTAPGVSGLTGAADFDFSPTPRLHLAVAASRDTGTATTFFRLGPLGINVDTNQLSTQFRASVNYAVSGKIAFEGQGRYNRGDLSSLLGSSHDRIQSYSLQANWDPLRSLRLSCSVAREVRDSTTVGLDSRATVSACSVALSVR